MLVSPSKDEIAFNLMSLISFLATAALNKGFGELVNNDAHSIPGDLRLDC